uniref:Uncharacterized protein n=1 Tax=Pyxicephalus adspersus TaxID=30357 RepID=A0AAV2ZGM1_PYXAD|nr:TPA: hypothetical protein GDO54_005511 [Pyxicephalus adspersus]
MCPLEKATKWSFVFPNAWSFIYCLAAICYKGIIGICLDSLSMKSTDFQLLFPCVTHVQCLYYHPKIKTIPTPP